MDKLERVREYFERDAADYDAYFKRDHQPRNLARFLAKNLLSPRAHEGRLQSVIDLSQPLSEVRSILEVGCGPGRYSLELARQGVRIVGVDFAPAMIAIANRLAREQGLDSTCQFLTGNILDHSFGRTFDISFATGVLDYIPPESRVPLLVKMRNLSGKAVIVSFPKRWHVHALLRKLWLGWKRVPVYFYTQRDIDSLFSRAGLKEVDSRDIGILLVKKAVPVADTVGVG